MNSQSPWYSTVPVVANSVPKSTNLYEPIRVTFKDESQLELYQAIYDQIRNFSSLCQTLGTTSREVLSGLPPVAKSILTVDFNIDTIEFDEEVPEGYARIYKSFNPNASFTEYQFDNVKFLQTLDLVTQEAQNAVLKLNSMPYIMDEKEVL